MVIVAEVVVVVVVVGEYWWRWCWFADRNDKNDEKLGCFFAVGT